MRDIRRLALVSMHTSPLDAPGQGDAGGLNVYVLELAKHLAGLGLEVDLITLAAANQPDSTTPISPKLRLIKLAAGKTVGMRKEDLPKLIGPFSKRLKELEPYDLIHAHYWLSGAASMQAARDRATPVVLNLHTVAAVKNALISESDQPEPDLRLKLEAELAQSVNCLVTSTTTEASAVTRYYLVDPRKIVTIGPGVNTRLFNPVGENIRELDLSDWPSEILKCLENDRENFLLMLGRVQPLKGQDLAIKALKALRGFGVRPRLLVAGEAVAGHETYARYLRELSQKLGLNNQVCFVQAVERRLVAKLMRSAYLLMVPSYSETFGLVTLEAAASGTPTIAFLTDGLKDSVLPGITGQLVADRNPESWARAIYELWGKPARYAEISRSAVEHAQENDWARTAERFLNLYRSL